MQDSYAVLVELVEGVRGEAFSLPGIPHEDATLKKDIRCTAFRGRDPGGCSLGSSHPHSDRDGLLFSQQDHGSFLARNPEAWLILLTASPSPSYYSYLALSSRAKT